MLKTKHFGEVISYCMGRSIGSYVPYAVHAFQVGDTLIDTGTIHAQREFAQALEGTPVATIINTHHHEDHIGNNHFFQSRFNTTIYAPRDALGYLEHPHDIGLHFYQRFVWDWPEPSQGHPLEERIACAGHTFEVIPAPGHCPDHICLLEPESGWLFTGDIFCGKIVRYLRADEDFHTILSSLKKLAGLDFSTLFCCLKGAVQDGKAELLGKIGYMEELLGNVMNLHTRGLSPKEIRRKLLGKEDAMFYMTGGHFAKQHVIDSILAQKNPHA
jgi:ribonuclease/clavin/mitogillin